MAGGKETPRQKMIGMMYLVLTALLALQVSNAVLEKFVFINATLTDLLNEEAQKNATTIASIEAAYNKKGKRPEHKVVLEKAKEIRETSKDLVVDINELKEKMIEVTGGYKEGASKGDHGQIVGVKDYDKVGGMMLHTDTGTKFEKTLDDYVAYLNSVIKEYDLSIDELHEITRTASEMDLFKNDPDQKNKDFLTITFDHTPTAAGLASVSQLGAEALEYETKVLSALAKKVDAALVDFNIIVPKVMPKTEVVPLGSDYIADLMLVAGGKGVNPEMKVNGNKIEVGLDENGLEVGKIKLPGSSAGTKSFKTEIFVPSSDTTFEATYSYEVIKPTMQITRGAASALYQNCANTLNVLVPMLGADFDPKYRATNAKSIPGSKGTVEVVPTTRRNVVLSVYSGSIFIDKQEFAVKTIPSPEANIMSGATQIDGQTANQAQIRNMSVQVKAEENFAKEAPKDATYFVREGKVLANGTFINFKGPKPKLPAGRITGTVVVYIDKVARKKYDGTMEMSNTNITKVVQVK